MSDDIELAKAIIKLQLDLQDIKEQVSEGQKEANKFKEAFQSSWTELNSSKEVLLEVFDKIQMVLDETVGKSVKYAAEVRSLSRDIGASAEDASKLIQAADDVGISFQTLQSGMRLAIRNGIEPTMAGMGELADQYLAIQDPIERTRFLMDNFGRSGAELGAMMEVGSAGIRDMGLAAEEAGLVLDEKAVLAAREYEIAMDDLGDSVDAAKIKLGNDMIPVINDLVAVSMRQNDIAEESGNGWMRNLGPLGLVVHGINIFRAAQELNTEEAQAAIDANAELAEQMDVTTVATEELKTAEELETEAKAAQKLQMDLVSGSLKELTAEIIFQKASQDLDAAAALELGRSMGVVNEASYGTLTLLQQLREKYDSNKDGLLDATEAASGYLDEVAAIGESYNKITDKSVTLTINGVMTGAFPDEYIPKTKNGEVPKFASGGRFTVPAGYDDDGFLMRVGSGEDVQVTPPGQSPGGDQLLLEFRRLREQIVGQQSAPLGEGELTRAFYAALVMVQSN